jgi:hypothetical protein
MIIIIKQKILTVTVRAFLSVKYCFISEIVKDGFYTRRCESKSRRTKMKMLRFIGKTPKTFGQLRESFTCTAFERFEQ